MSPLSQAVAREHVNDLLRQAERSRQLRRAKPRRLRK
jgi:hypothetical protein